MVFCLNRTQNPQCNLHGRSHTFELSFHYALLRSCFAFCDYVSGLKQNNSTLISDNAIDKFCFIAVF